AQDSGSGIRLVGPFRDFGIMASYLVLSIPVFLAQFWKWVKEEGSGKKALYFALLAGCCLILLYLTRTRGAILALGVSILFLFVYKRWFKALGGAFLLGLAMLAILPQNVIIHKDAQGKEQSFVERVELWKRAVQVIQAKPWTGTGINTYNVAHAKYDKEQNWRVRGYYAHNGYLQLAAETGIPCILTLCAFLGIFFYKALRHIKKLGDDPEALMQLGILTGLLAFLIYALVDTNLQSPQSLVSFWFMAGILLARQKIVPGGSKA
nr:O-antigen ligase family protein [Candidatus Omnitrophota bacterium]